jgi:hypothetical protein
MVEIGLRVSVLMCQSNALLRLFDAQLATSHHAELKSAAEEDSR